MTRNLANPLRLPASRLALALLLCWAGALLLPYGPALAVVLDPRTVKSATLDNGLVLVVCEEPAAQPARAGLVAVELIVRVGSADEPPELAGAAHLLEHVCWVSGGGNDPRARIEAAGGTTNAGTLRDYTRYYATLQAGELKVALQALGDMVLRPRLEYGVVERERRAILEEIATRQDVPRIRLNDLAFRELFGDSHPYGRAIEGTESSLARIEAHELAAFHSTWYVPNNIAVVVVGETTFDAALREVQQLFGERLPQALPSSDGLRAEVERPGVGRECVVPTPGDEAYVMAAFAGPAASERPEVCASDVLSTILSYGCLGRLSAELVERRKLAKSLGVDFLTQRDRALFGVWAVCDPANLPAVKETIRAELQRLASQPVSPAELTVAKRLVYAGYCFANETPAGRAATLAFYEAVDTYRAATQYPARVGAVDAADISTVAAWYASEPVWVVLRPERAQDPYGRFDVPQGRPSGSEGSEGR